jgi:hypothetical protein
VNNVMGVTPDPSRCLAQTYLSLGGHGQLPAAHRWAKAGYWQNKELQAEELRLIDIERAPAARATRVVDDGLDSARTRYHPTITHTGCSFIYPWAVSWLTVALILGEIANQVRIIRLYVRPTIHGKRLRTELHVHSLICIFCVGANYSKCSTSESALLERLDWMGVWITVAFAFFA